MKKMSKKVKGISVLLALGLFLLVAAGIWLAQGPQSLVGKTNETKVEKKTKTQKKKIVRADDYTDVPTLTSSIIKTQFTSIEENGELVYDDVFAPGFVTKEKAEQEGWVRSNDTVSVRYLNNLISTTQYEDVKIKFQINFQNAYSDYDDKTREPLKNVTVSTGGFEEIIDDKTLKTTTWEKTVTNKGTGDFQSDEIKIKLNGSFYGTEIPVKITAVIVSATNTITKEEVEFEGEEFEYELPNPFPDGAIKVTSRLSLRPIISFRGVSSKDDREPSAPFDELIAGLSLPEQPNDGVMSVGYAWSTEGLRHGLTRSSIVGLAVPRGNNPLKLVVNQKIFATLRDGTEKELKLGEEIPPMTVFAYGLPGTDFTSMMPNYKNYSDYNKTILATNYSPNAARFATGARIGITDYNMVQNNEKITVQALAPIKMPGITGDVSVNPNGYLFGIGSFITYYMKEFDLFASKLRSEEYSDVIEQKYELEIVEAEYIGNEGEPERVEAQVQKKSWVEKFPENEIDPEREWEYTLNKTDDSAKSLSGAEFVLQISKDNEWITIQKDGEDVIYRTDEQGQIKLTEEQLKALFDEYGEGPYRFLETKVPEGFRDPEEEVTTEFTIDKRQGVKPSSATITNTSKKQTIELSKKGEKNVSLVGVKFVLCKWNEATEQWIETDFTYTTDKYGKIKLTEEVIKDIQSDPKLGNGKYCFKETETLEEYELPENPYTDPFEVMDDDVQPNTITMVNQKKGKLVKKTDINVYSAYGFEKNLEKSSEKGFAYLPRLYSNAHYIIAFPGYDDFENAKARHYSGAPNAESGIASRSSNIQATFQGSEIIVGSSLVAQCYEYMSNQQGKYQNWRAVSSQMLQLWNPEEGEFIEAFYTDYETEEAKKEIGELEKIRYFVKKDETYSAKVLQEITLENFQDHYDEVEDEAEAQRLGKKISAVLGAAPNLNYDYSSSSDPVETRWNMYTRRAATGKKGIVNYPDDTGIFYETITRGEITYEKEDSHESHERLEVDSGEFKPGRVNENGMSETTSNPYNSYGASLFIGDLKPKLTKKAYDVETNREKTKFQIDETILFKLTLDFSALPIVNQGYNVIFSDYVETENFAVVPGSSRLEGRKIDDPTYEEKEGKDYYTWEEIKVFPDKNKTLTLSFEAVPIKSGDFRNYGEVSGDNVREGPSFIMITVENKRLDGGIRKTTSTPVIEKTNESYTNKIDYQLMVQNYLDTTPLKDVRLLDVIPYDDDEHDSGGKLKSKFEGNIKVASLKAENSMFQNIEDAEFYYITDVDPKAIGNDANKIEESSFWRDGKWKLFTESIPEEDQTKVVAVYVKLPELRAESFYRVILEMYPEKCEVGDVFYNHANLGYAFFDKYGVLQPDNTGLSAVVETVVVNRQIVGSVWIDGNYDGLLATTETKVEKIPVVLLQEDDQGSWNPVQTSETDQKGNYDFQGITSGNYLVGFELVDEYKDWLITRTNIPIPPNRPDILGNNKVSQTDVIEVDGKTYHLTENAVAVPYTVTNPETGLLEPNIVVDGINMGILAKPGLQVTKAVYNKDNVDINGEKVKVGDIIRYEITVENPQENSYVGDVRIYDKLPRGLVYVPETLKKHLIDGTTEELADSNFNEEGTILSTEPLGSIRGATATTGEKITISFEVLVTSGANGKLVNQASATGELHPDGSGSNEVDNDLLPDLTIKKTSNWDDPQVSGIPKVGDIIEYTLTVENAAGASTAKNVVVTDTLPDYLEYVPGSTSLQDPSGPAPSVTPGESVPQDDKEIWNLEPPQSLSIAIGDFEGSATGLTKTITFKVKLKELPDEEENGSRTIINEAVVTGEDLDGNPLEEDDENRIPLTNITNKAKLHVRQDVVKREESLVVPTVGYLRLTQLGGDNKVIPKASSAINIVSTLNPAEETFTIFELALDTDEEAVRFDLNVPQYYEYIGEVHTKTFEEPDKEKHDTDKPEETNVLTLPDVKDSDEYWISLYLRPKFGKEEEHPRPYSWDYKTNNFGNWKSSLSNK